MMSPAVRATPRSLAMIECYKIPPERITVIPRAVDTARFSPAAVTADHIASLRRNWGVLPQTRVVLVPSRIAPRNGQMTVIDAARLLVSGGDRNVAFVFAGDGMVVRPDDVGQLARALGAALALDVTGYEALGARARQFAEFVFFSQSVAEAFRGVYTSLLARDS